MESSTLNLVPKQKELAAQATSIRAFLLSLAVFVILLAWILVAAFGAYPDDQTAAILLLSSIVIAAFAVLSSHEERQWSLPFLSFLVLSLFHIGLFLSVAIFNTVPTFLLATDPKWFLDADLGAISTYLAVSFMSFTMGILLPALFRNSRPQLLPLPSPLIANIQRKALSDVGSVVVIISVGVWFIANIQLNGLFFFLGTYHEYLDSTQGSIIGLTFMGIGLGLTMTAQHVHGFLGRASMFSFLLFALAGFPLGLRGEVLMPLVAAVAVQMKYVSKRPRWLLLFLGSTATFLLITLGKQVRRIGLENVTDSEFSFRLLDAVEEMGASMRVLATSIQWHLVDHEPFAMGSTYVTPILRNFSSLFGLNDTPTSQDFGLFNVEIAQRVGPIGGSVIGEAHHNFGLVGLVVVLFLWGAAISLANINAFSPLRIAFLGLVGMLFLMHVRNASTPLFMWLMVGVLLIFIATRLGDFRQRPAISGELPGG